MASELILKILTPLTTVLVGVLVWSLKRNLQELDVRIERMAADLRQVTVTVGGHTETLARDGVTLEALKDRVEQLEERERVRGCFGGCPSGRRSSERTHGG